MGVNYFVFGDVDSRDYDIEVFFKDIDHTPKRVYEIIEVPGRNGAIYIDQNRYEDVPVAYDCVALDDADRKSFTSALASQTGYRRLQDNFNSTEFYNAVFDGDIDPHVTAERDQSTFTVYFTRSPQRYLTDGETAVSVDDGDTLTNPTLFEAHPLLEVEGYGQIVLNGYDIRIEDEPVGEIELVPAQSGGISYLGDYRENMVLLEDGDDMILDSFQLELTVKLSSFSGNPYKRIRNANFSRTASNLPNYIGVDTVTVSNQEVKKIIKYGAQSFVKQSTAVETVDSCKLEISLEDAGGTATTYNYTFDILVKLQGAGTSQGKGHLAIQRTNPSSIPSNYYSVRPSISASAFVGISTQSVLGDPTYIDCEIGEAYKEIGSQIFPLNRYIDLGSKLPELSAGDNEIEINGNITSLVIVPRWWEV